MQQVSDPVAEMPEPFPVIRATLKNKNLVVRSGSAAVAVLGFWLAIRTGFVEIYPMAIALAFAVNLILKAALEVVELVAETLMPR